MTVDAGGAVVGESQGAARSVVLQRPAGAQPARLQIDGKAATVATDGNRVRFTLPEGEHKFSL